MQFKQDDKALCTLNDQVVEVQFGPVKNSVGNPAYLVKWPNGVSSMVWEDDLQPAPRFKVGQEVRSKFLEGSLIISAGPFAYRTGDDFYVLEKADGTHTTELEYDLSPV